MSKSTSSSGSRNTLITAMVVIGLGAFAVWDGSRKKENEKKVDDASLIVPIETAAIQGLNISNIKGEKIVLERLSEAADSSKAAVKGGEKDETSSRELKPQSAGIGKWKMLEPIKDSADVTTIESVLSSIRAQKSRQVVSEGKEVNWAVFGLDHPVVTLVITAKDKAGKTLTETVEIGGVKAYDSSLYARIDHQDRALLVGSEWDAILSKLPREYRDKRLLRGRENLNFAKVELTARTEGKNPAMHFVLNQKDEKWSIDDGIEADKSEKISDLDVRNYVSQIKAAHALNFINDDKTAPGALRENELVNPLTTLKLTPDDGSSVITLQFGPSPKGVANVAATSSELEPIVNVYASFVQGLRKPAKEFFDKRAPFKFRVADVARVRIQTKGSLAQEALNLELEKRGNEWRLATNGLQKQIDTSKLNEMIQRISDLDAVRFVQPIEGLRKSHEPLPKKAKAGGDLGLMSNHIRLMREDRSLVFELKWGDLLFEKSDVSGLSPEDAKLPGQVDAQFTATETSESRWVMGVPEGSLRDLKIHEAVASPLPTTSAGAPKATTGLSPKGKTEQVPIATPMPTPMANFEPVEKKK